MAYVAALHTVNALATELGRDRRTIANALRAVTPDGKSGRWDAWYLTTALKALGSGDGNDALDWNAERTRKAKEEADALAMKNAQARGELIPRETFHIMVTSAFARVRARLLAMPSKLAPLVDGLSTPAEVQSLIKDSVHDALSELSATTVAEIPDDEGAEAVGGGGVSGDLAGAGAAAGSDDLAMGG